MSRIFITGSTDGLGLMAAELLLKDGHQVTLHARSQARAADARTRLPGADGGRHRRSVRHRRTCGR